MAKNIHGYLTEDIGDAHERAWFWLSACRLQRRSACKLNMALIKGSVRGKSLVSRKRGWQMESLGFGGHLIVPLLSLCRCCSLISSFFRLNAPAPLDELISCRSCHILRGISEVRKVLSCKLHVAAQALGNFYAGARVGTKVQLHIDYRFPAKSPGRLSQTRKTPRNQH